MFLYVITEGINDIAQNQRGTTLQSGNTRGPIHSYPDPNIQGHFPSNMTVSPKGGSNRMFHNQAKMPPGSVFPTGHFTASQQSSNVLHQMHNNNNSSHQQQHLNQPWSNGSAGSSGWIQFFINQML